MAPAQLKPSCRLRTARAPSVPLNPSTTIWERFAHWEPSPVLGHVMDCWRILCHLGFISDIILPWPSSISETTTCELGKLSPDNPDEDYD